MSDSVLDEALAIRDALRALKRVRSVKVQYSQSLKLGLKLVTLVYTYKIGEQHSSSDRYTQEIRVLLETLIHCKQLNRSSVRPHLKLLRWYAQQTVRVIRGLLNPAQDVSNERRKVQR
jgi:hypothetical protein